MDCKIFREMLDRYLSGDLAAHLFDAMVAHEAGCAACHELASAMMSAPGVAWNQDAQPGPAEPAAAWLARTLDRTVGADCDYMRLRLAEAVDAPLVPDTARRVDLHLEGCPECAALAVVLRELPVYYDALERLRADDAFAAEVIARTMPARPSWRAVLRALVRRPEALWEGAVVCAILTAPLAGPSMTGWIRSARQAGSQVEQKVDLSSVTNSLGNHVTAAGSEVVLTIDGGRRAILDGLTRMRARVEDSITATIDKRAASDPRVAVVAPALKDALGRLGLINGDSIEEVKPAWTGEAAAKGRSTAPDAAGPDAQRDVPGSASPEGPDDRSGTTAAPGQHGTEEEPDELR
jgi:predicted anti-sigma-YlaC factor YlaD